MWPARSGAVAKETSSPLQRQSPVGTGSGGRGGGVGDGEGNAGFGFMVHCQLGLPERTPDSEAERFQEPY